MADKILDDFIEQHTNAVDKAMGYDPALKILSKKAEKEQVRIEITEGLNQFIHHIQRGFKLLKETIGTLSIQDPEHFSLVSEAQQFLNRDFDKDTRLSDKGDGNKSLKEIYGLSDQTINTFYLIANYYYTQKKFLEASEILFFICLLDPLNTVYWQALGSANYFCGHYREALYAYFVSLTLNPDGDPHCLFYAARCYEAQLDFDKALDCVDTALEIIESGATVDQTLLNEGRQYRREIEERSKINR